MIFRGAVFFLSFSLFAYGFIYLLTIAQRHEVRRSGMQVAIAAGIGLVATIILALLNNVSGL